MTEIPEHLLHRAKKARGKTDDRQEYTLVIEYDRDFIFRYKAYVIPTNSDTELTSFTYSFGFSREAAVKRAVKKAKKYLAKKASNNPDTWQDTETIYL